MKSPLIDNFPEENKLFSQSRVLNTLNWRSFYDGQASLIANDNDAKQITAANEQTPIANPGPGATIDCSREYNEEATIAFNRVHFHQQIYNALSANPLSTLYSLAWSLCLHIEGKIEEYNDLHWFTDRNAPYPNDAEYIRVWFPFILMHRMTEQLSRLIGNLASEDKEYVSNASREENNLFTLSDIRAAEKRFRQSFYSVLYGNDEISDDHSLSPDELNTTRSARYHADKEAYLSSPLFHYQCQRTPYGLSEVYALEDKNSNENRYRMRFIPNMSDLSDKKKVLYNFKRYQAYEPLRIRAEQVLRARFPHYHAKQGIFLDSWLFGAISPDEATTTTESNQRSYVVYWQLHKSAILWILVHSLFALNDCLNNLMLEDLLWFIAHDLERFIECGLCHSHWTSAGGGQASWQAREENFIRQQHSAGANDSISRVNKMATGDSFDLKMLRTHNDIQMQNVNPAKGLTEAALNALRKDYAHFAGALMGCLVEDSKNNNIKRPPANNSNAAENTPTVPFRCSIYDLELARRDVCKTPAYLYRTLMLQDTGHIRQTAHDDKTVLTCTLALERKHLDEHFNRHFS